MWNRPSSMAFSICRGSMRDEMFCLGRITPCVPVRPETEHALKNPCIFSLIPPTGCSAPIWLTDPVTAISCLIGISAIAERRKYILDSIVREGFVKVSVLAEKFGVTQTTIRKDLNHLEAKGLLYRAYGSALPTAAQVMDITMSTKRLINFEKKQKIAEAAAALNLHTVPVKQSNSASEEWLLVDFGGILVHLMTAPARAFYDLENLWFSAEKIRPASAGENC